MNECTTVSVIIPTIGRTNSLSQLLDSLAEQTLSADEIIVADASSNADIAILLNEWSSCSGRCSTLHLHVDPPNAVTQREAAIKRSTGDLILLLDDDVVLAADCIEHLVSTIRNDDSLVAVSADFSNQRWPRPTRLWQLYLKTILKVSGDEWQGKVLGPLLRFGYQPVPSGVLPMQWFGSGNTLLRREVYNAVGGFSEFFYQRSTMHEDVELSLRVAEVGKIVLCSEAKMAHFHDPYGRSGNFIQAKDDLLNRHYVLQTSFGCGPLGALLQVSTFTLIETLSLLRRVFAPGGWRRLTEISYGRWAALCEITWKQ